MPEDAATAPSAAAPEAPATDSRPTTPSTPPAAPAAAVEPTKAPAAEKPEDAPLGKEGEKALEAWKLRARDAEKVAKEATARIEEHEEAQKTELEKAQSKASKLEQRATTAETKLLRYEVASDKKVPAEAVDLLNGSTKEELEASADKILSLVKTDEATPPKKEEEPTPPPSFDGGAREAAPEAQDPATAHNKLVVDLFGGHRSATT